MTISFTNVIAKIASIDIFKRNSSTGNFETGLFIRRPFHLDYEKACILVADAWKLKAKGIPQGSFLLAYYENEPNVHEALLLRVLKPTKLPTDNNVISSMIEYYKDNLKTSGKESQLDTYTRYEFSFSGLECRVLGTFYKDDTGRTRFGADVENFYSSHNYKVIKPNSDILELLVNFRDQTIRYSTIKKDGFKVMKVNFYQDILSGFELIRSHLDLETSDYVKSFLSIDLQAPTDKTDYSAATHYARKKAAYLCCLYKAGFSVPANFKINFPGNKDLNLLVKEDGSLDPSKGISLEDASNWFTTIWENYANDYFVNYKRTKGGEWADEDLRALLVFLTRKSQPGAKANVSGYVKLRDVAILHTDTTGKPFEEEIIEELRKGRIIIVDLSQGDPEIQRLYSERICRQIFADAMSRFIENSPNNFIQFYFEEAHNLFPKKDDKDLSQIYNRIAKEGAKLNLGMVYATQEVSSISSNILKNTQNWFIAHLNNEDETKEIKKYYDFGDFTESLVRFSADTDKGFVRMKTYSNAFVVPTQIDRFSKI